MIVLASLDSFIGSWGWCLGFALAGYIAGHLFPLKFLRRKAGS